MVKKIKNIQKEKFYWKVLFVKTDGTLHSCVVRNTLYNVEYEIGKTIYPSRHMKNSKLLVFKTRQQAREFKNRWRHHTHQYRVIYKVRVISPTLITFVEPYSNMAYERSCHANWCWCVHLGGNKLLTEHEGYMCAPEGTIGVDSLRLVERVW